MVNGHKRWRVRWHENEKPKRKFFKSKSDADAHIAKLRGEQTGINEFWSALSQDQRKGIFSAWHEAEKRGLDLLASVMEASSSSRGHKSKACVDVLAEMEKAKTAAGLDPVYVRTIRHAVKKLIKKRERVPIDRITLTDVEAFLNGYGPHYRKVLRSRLSTWFKFAMGPGRAYCRFNPCTALERIRAEIKPPRIFTYKEMEALLKWLPKNPAPFGWFVLSTFCGLRPDEARKTEKGMVNFDEGWIRVEAQTTKVAQRRVVYPIAGAMTLLKRAIKKSKLPMKKKALTEAQRDMRAVIGLKEWPQDVTRHTAASLWIALEEDIASVAKNLGNSENILKSRYKALVTRAEAEKLWSLVK